MEEKREAETFHYAYSARQQEEINQIRQKYLPKEETKMDQLRKLDESSTRPGTIAAIIVGVLGLLLLGVGMCCTMVWSSRNSILFIPGILIGILGMLCMAVAYPLFAWLTKRKREKIAPQILKLTDELSQQK